MATTLIAECGYHEFGHDLVNQLLDCAFGYLDEGIWVKTPEYLSDTARLVIKLTNQKILDSVLRKTYADKPASVQLSIASLLIENDQIETTAINILQSLAQDFTDLHICMRAAEELTSRP